ncbi:MAG: GntR family transcriptional regulator [Candidatus Marinimicrobia bacterium]|nr:GntR family transcriptional regulator [Candidatus Neomarinimicrobiota bacterium]
MGINQHDPKPFYKQVSEDIISQIRAGQLKVGDKLETQHELASKYDVSLITIKKALSDLIAGGILYARVGKGTYIARRPSRIDYSKHQTIAYVLKDLDNPFYQSIVSSVERNLSKNSCNLILYSSDNRREYEERKIRYFVEMGVSGLILGSMSHSHLTSSLIKQLQDENFPFIMVSYTDDPSICFIGTDQKYGGFIATEHLIKTGYSSIGYVNGEEGNLVGEARKEGYLQALEENNITLNEKYIYRIVVSGKRDDFKSGYDVGMEFCTAVERPRAMFVYNDLSALGFIDALNKFGLSVPDDVAIVGFDDIAIGHSSAIPLTTVHQPTDKIGKLVVEQLLRRISGSTTTTACEKLKPELIVRKSCGVN